MAYVTSATEVCNLALDILKQESIASIESPLSLTEGVCARWYDLTRRALLRSHPWSFARKRTTVARDAVAPTGFEDSYALPNDCVRVLFVGESYEEQDKDLVIEDGKVLLDNGGAVLKLCYVYDVTNVLKMDPLFVDLLAMELALKIFPALVGLKPSVQLGLSQERQRLISQARAINGQENPVKVIHKSGILTARFHGNVLNDRYLKVVGY